MPTNSSAGQYLLSTVQWKELGEKVSGALTQGINQEVEEARWMKRFPKNRITLSQNENWFPVQLEYDGNVASIPEFGYEAEATSPGAVEAKFMPVQLNKRYAFSDFADVLDRQSAAGYVERQIAFQTMNAIWALSNTVGLQFYGSSSNVWAQVDGASSADTDHTIPVKNIFGNSNIPGNTTTRQKKYANLVIRTNEKIAIVRAGAVVEFGVVTASPSPTGGDGQIDITLNSSVALQDGDLIVGAAAVIDSTLTGTGYNLGPNGWTSIFNDDSLHGISRTTNPNWGPGHEGTTAQRMSFQVRERAHADIRNASGQTVDRNILSQGVRIDAIAGELGARRYDSAKMDLEGELAGREYLDSRRVPPGMAIYWNSQSFGRVELGDLPAQGSKSRAAFRMDKIQERSGQYMSINYWMQYVVSVRSACGYDANLEEL
jgi:hypothetical protein